MPQSNSFEQMTKELYSKNLDLLNANKIFELIQKLYEIMVSSYSLESVSQRFIDVICETMGFTDGVVTTIHENSDHLHVVAVTQTQINKTLLDLANTATVNLKFMLDVVDNALVRVYLSGKNETVAGISDIWTPYIKDNDIAGIASVLGKQSILVYPIVFGDRILGSFALFLGRRSIDLTEFEKKALDRLMTVFGIAIDRVKINIELRESEKRELAKSKELLKLKDEFVFIATHDLRTPVTAISGFVELLERDKKSFATNVQSSFEAIKQSSERLNQLINDLLQVARSDSGTVEVELKNVDISNLIKNVIREVGPSASEMKVEVHSNLDEVQKFVLADEAKLTEVVENLLSNAIKYNKIGGRVDVTSTVTNQELTVRVSDTGFGIPKEKLSGAFQKFFRARQKGTETVSGTGLGLFVTKMLLEKMGGKIELISSVVEKGSVFTFTLPTAK